MKKSLIWMSAVCMMLGLSACGTSSTTEDTKIDMKTIQDVRGDVAIPAEPQRIVDISGNSDILSILGYRVAGTANSDAYDYTILPVYLKNALGEAAILGYSMQDTMDVEAIMSVDPDLIIISTVQEKMYEQLKAIAPTVMVQNEALNWKQDIRNMAKVFEREEQAEAWIDAYEKKAMHIGNNIKEAYGEDTTYVAILASGGQFFVFSGAGFGDLLYKDLGLGVPAGMPSQSDISLPVVTYEGLAQIDADYIFAIATDESLQELQSSSIWNGMRAVKDHHVVTLPNSPYFNQGYSPIGRDLLLDELEGMLRDAT